MQAAVELATHFGSELWFMHVVVPVPVTVPGPEPLLIDVMSTGSELEESAKESLEKMVAQFQLTGLKTRLTILKGDPADEILRVAEDEVVDLILLTTHGRTRLDYFIFGSVAEKVMRLSPCPVLTVRGSSHMGEEKADEGVPSEKNAPEDQEKGTSEDVPRGTANYLERLEGQLKEWEAALGRLTDTVEASTFKADVKTKYGHQIDDLKRRQEAAQTKLIDMKETGEAAWEGLRSATEKNMGDLKETYNGIVLKFKETKDRAQEKISKKKQVYTEKAEAELREWGATIELLKGKANSSKAEAKTRYAEEIEKLQGLQTEAVQKFQELKGSGDEAWTDLKGGLDRALGELKQSLKNAFARFKDTRED